MGILKDPSVLSTASLAPEFELPAVVLHVAARTCNGVAPDRLRFELDLRSEWGWQGWQYTRADFESSVDGAVIADIRSRGARGHPSEIGGHYSKLTCDIE